MGIFEAAMAIILIILSVLMLGFIALVMVLSIKTTFDPNYLDVRPNDAVEDPKRADFPRW